MVCYEGSVLIQQLSLDCHTEKLTCRFIWNQVDQKIFCSGDFKTENWDENQKDEKFHFKKIFATEILLKKLIISLPKFERINQRATRVNILQNKSITFFFFFWLSLVHNSCRSQKLSQRARFLQIIGNFSIFTGNRLRQFLVAAYLQLVWKSL